MNAQLKEELLKVNEYEEEFLVCEPDHGSFLFESNENTKEKSTEDLMNHMKDSK